jgi:DNA-binding MarR family transcriptional regulator
LFRGPAFAQHCVVLVEINVTKQEKYVNMADIISSETIDDADIIVLIELLFFAYRDFVSDPDELLATFGFGRAHHRVLHFVGRDSGMTVAQLLDILRITKQSLGRVLKELIDKGYIYQKEGEFDRRQRLLFLTQQGEKLRQRLIAPQFTRIRRAIGVSGAESAGNYRELLFNLVSPGNREQVEDWLKKVGRG